MSLYRELRPDPANLPIEIAMTSLEQSRRALTRPFGQAIVTNGAGGTSILGAGGGDGLIPWVDDSEPPSRPTGLSAASTSQVITVHWDGTLEYGLPADFHSIEIHIQPDGGDDTVIGTLRVAGDVASGLLTEGDIVDVWAVALDDAHDRVGEWTPNRSEASDVITLVVEPVVSQGQLRDKADEILGAAKEDTAAQIDKVNTTITEAQQAIKSNHDGLEQEAYLRAEGDKLAQDAAAAVKAETDKLATKYDTMDTDVKSVKNDLKTVMTSTTQLEQDMIVSTLIEYAVGDSDTVPPTLATYWTGEPNNSVSVLSDPWGPTTPERTPGTYIWMRTRVTFGDGGQETSAPVLVTGNTGAQGPQGVPGEPGEDGLPGAAGTNGKTSYLHLAYANSADGRTDFSTSDSNRDYIGQYTDFTQQDSTDPSKYSWSKIKGAQGAQGLKGDPGATGLPGEKGADGRTSYAHFAYANSSDGRTDFSTTNGTNKKYIGQYVDFVEADSTDPTKYTWSLIVGPQGPQGPQGVAGAKGDKGDDGVTRYSYFAYGTSASGANFSTTPTSASTYIGVCVTTAATQPTDPTKYTWSLTKGATGPAGPQGAAGAKGDVGEDGKTYYTYFAYGTSASGANFSTTPTANSTYMGVCITLDATQPTTPASYTWSLTKGNQGATGAQGVSVSALTPFWQLAESKPAQPVNKAPGGGWSSTEPAYVRGKKLWTCSRIDYSNGQWSWTSVQQSSAFEAAELALTTADGKNRRFVQPTTPVVPASELTQGDEWWQTSSKPPETYWMGTPNNSVSVLVDHSNEVEHIWVWNGTRWALNRLSAEDIIVSGSVAAGLVTADFFDGARIRGGEFVTSNELIRLNNAGLIMDGKSGERLVTLNATDGTATFWNVAIINGSLSVPTIEGGTINGAAFNLTDASGSIIGRLNSSGISFGDKLTFAKKSGEWVLSLKGAIQSGGEISGAAITGAVIRTNTEWQSSEAAKKYRGLVITSGGMFAYKNNGKEEYSMAFTAATGELKLDGAIAANASLTGATINGGVVYGATVTTNPNYASTDPTLRDRGVWINSNGLVAYDADGKIAVRIDATTGALYAADGVNTNGTFNIYDTDGNITVNLGPGTFGIYKPSTDADPRRFTYLDADNHNHRRLSLWGENGIVYNTQTGWDSPQIQSPCVDMGLQKSVRGGLLVYRGRVKCPNSGDNIISTDTAYNSDHSATGFMETYGTNRSAVAVGFRNNTAQPCIVCIPANTRQLVAMNGPWDWVDLTGVTFGQ